MKVSTILLRGARIEKWKEDKDIKKVVRLVPLARLRCSFLLHQLKGLQGSMLSRQYRKT